jgi:RNA polymerase sigma-70 factor (ECF subfamily)
VTQQPQQSPEAGLRLAGVPPPDVPAPDLPAPDGSAPGPRQREDVVRSLQRAHGRALLGFVLSEVHGDRQTAEDIVQETMLRAWQHADAAGMAAAPRSYLFTIAHRLVIDRWRRLSVRPEEVAGADLGHLGVRDHADAALSGLVVREALAGLDERHRAVIVLVHLDGRSVRQAAATLGIPTGTVKSRLFHAVRALRVALEAKGETGLD